MAPEGSREKMGPMVDEALEQNPLPGDRIRTTLSALSRKYIHIGTFQYRNRRTEQGV